MTPADCWDTAATDAMGEILTRSHRCVERTTQADAECDLAWIEGRLSGNYDGTDWQYIGAMAWLNLIVVEQMPPIIANVVISKQHDYGKQNILSFGEQGVRIRAYDKVCRLQHLLGKTTDPKNESIVDTWVDLIGYSIVAIMLRNDTFSLPMRQDRIEQAEDDRAEKSDAAWAAWEKATLDEDTILDAYKRSDIEIVNAPLEDVVAAISEVIDRKCAALLASHHSTSAVIPTLLDPNCPPKKGYLLDGMSVHAFDWSSY
jgi:hypothetical protein